MDLVNHILLQYCKLKIRVITQNTNLILETPGRYFLMYKFFYPRFERSLTSSLKVKSESYFVAQSCL